MSAATLGRRVLIGVATAALLVLAAPTGTAGAATPATGAVSAARVAAAAPVQVPVPPVSAASRPAVRSAAAERAAELSAERRATAAQRARASWDGHGRPTKLIIVRAGSIDTVAGGVLTRRTTRVGGVLTLSRLDRYVPSSWLSIADGRATLSAALVLTPGVVLDVGGDVTTLALAGGATATDAASIYTGSGRLAVHGATVTSVDPSTGAAAPPGPGRPFVAVASGGRLEATDATFSDLGTPSTDPEERAGVLFNAGSGGSLVRTALLRNSTGLKLDGAVGVRLDGVTVAESVADGLVLRGDQGTTLVGVRAERNAGEGVLVTGPASDRPITGLVTNGNGQYGISVVAQAAPKITGVVAQADHIGGLRLSGSTGAVVSDFSAVDEPVGVFTHLDSSGVVLDRLRITGGDRGVVVEKTTRGLTLSQSTIERSGIGVSIGGQDVELRDVGVTDARSGVRVERGAAGVTAALLTVTGGQDGIVVIPGTSRVVLQDVVTDGVANNAVRNSGTDTRIVGGRISGSTTGIDAQAATSIDGTAIDQVDVGIRARSTGLVAADAVDVSAISSGISVEDGSPFTLTDSHVDALLAVDGQADLQGLNDLSLPPLNLLGAIGVPLILLALALEHIQAARQRAGGGDRPRLPPTLHARPH